MIIYPFFKMVQHLREQEQIMLYTNLLEPSDEDQQNVGTFLSKEYAQECLDYPHTAPDFDVNAAIWAAKTVYVAAQLMLYREHRATDLQQLFPAYDGKKTAAAVLSADLLLRFLPIIAFDIKMIDSEDELIHILQEQLSDWHYSAVNYTLEVDKLDFNAVVHNPCLYQLYTNRIIKYKKINLAKHPLFVVQVNASMGIFANNFWKEFNT